MLLTRSSSYFTSTNAAVKLFRHYSSARTAPSQSERQSDLLVPRFWTGKPAIDSSVYSIDCSRFDMRANFASPALEDRIKHIFNSVGVVLLKNTGLESDLGAMRRWAKVVMPSEMKYEGGANSRGEIVENVFDTGAPKEAWLHYHHEMAYVRQSTRMLAFCCSAAVKDKGAMFLSDNVAVTDSVLKTEFGQKLRERGICYIRCLTDEEEGTTSGVYNHWQRSFGETDPVKVEDLAKLKGLEVAWGPGRYLRTKHYTSGFEYFPQLDRNLLYSSIADNGEWFDTWPGVAELPNLDTFESATPSQRPLKITYGDDSEMSQDDLFTFMDVYDQHGFPIEWERGDVAVVCNYRFAHGRPQYSLEAGEERVLGVVLGEMYDRVGQRDDKW